MGNFPHVGNKLIALIDFDWSIKAPKFRVLAKLLRSYMTRNNLSKVPITLKNTKAKLYNLNAYLKAELKELFDDKLLLKKIKFAFC